MKIYIPSYKRAERVETLKLLQGIEKDVFLVVRPEEKEIYEKHNSQVSILAEQKSGGMGVVKNQILQHAKYHGEKYIWILDDDVTGLFKREGRTKGGYNKLVRMNRQEIASAMVEMEKMMQKGFAMGGFNYQQLTWHNEEEYLINKCPMVFVILDVEQVLAIGGYDDKAELFEDIEVIVRLFRNAKQTLVANKFSFSYIQMAQNQGGLQEAYTKIEKTRAFANYVAEKHKPFITVVQKKAHNNIYEPKVKWAQLLRRK